MRSARPSTLPETSRPRARNLQQAVTLDPAFATAHANLGLALLQAGESEAAARAPGSRHRNLRQVSRCRAIPIICGPRSTPNRTRSKRQPRNCSEAVSLQPDFAEAWSDLGQARKTLLDDDAGLRGLRALRRTGPPKTRLRNTASAPSIFAASMPPKPCSHLRESYRLNPQNQSTLYSLQLALRQDGKLEEAARIKEELAVLLRQNRPGESVRLRRAPTQQRRRRPGKERRPPRRPPEIS